MSKFSGKKQTYGFQVVIIIPRALIN
uniref:Uncharacterized protein n=1 Tax=Tetranychus urticae TaxID=32264 RepID=T1JTB1_TETUR